MNRLLTLFKNEPVMALSVLVAAALGIVGVAVDVNTIFNVLVVVAPLVGGVIKRATVVPVAKLEAEANKVADEIEAQDPVEAPAVEEAPVVAETPEVPVVEEAPVEADVAPVEETPVVAEAPVEEAPADETA